MRNFHLPGRSPVLGTNGMAATSNPLASKVAIDLLERGGNAIDAAIGAAVLQGLLEPQMTGIGGDCFVLIAKAGQSDVIALNGSGRAPAGLCADKLRAAGHKTMPTDSADAVTIPGAIDAFCRLSDDHGKLGLDAILAPAIHYMRSGVPISARNAFDWALAAPKLRGRAGAVYLNNSKPYGARDIFKLPQQAEVLEKIAHQGRAGFYEGDVAQDMATSLQALGGAHTLDDFANNKCDYTIPISGDYKGTRLIEHPPNGQGAIAILMNNMLAQFDLPSMDPFGVARAHLEAEIAKLAYDARDRFIGDPTTQLDYLLADETAQKLAAKVDPKRAMAAPAAANAGAVHKDTICLSVVDQNLIAVSLIYSVFHDFGSTIASDKYGILFQNRGAGFNLIPGHVNEAGGTKRPLQTIIPGMLSHDGRVDMAFGIMGGAYQPNGHARFISNMVDFDLHPQAAIDAPRSFSDAGVMKVEHGYSDAVRQGLVDLGHNVIIPEVPIGGAQVVQIDHQRGVLIGASDPRKDGAALGY